MLRGWALWLVAGVSFVAGPVHAEPPSCFPERTVLGGAELLDAQGVPLAAIRAGHAVRVLADRVGERGDQAMVEISAPLRLEGRVPRDALVVFARDEIEVVKDRVFWLAGRGLRIERGDQATAAVTWDEREAGPAPYPVVSVACARLSGVPLAPVRRNHCEGARAQVQGTLREPVVSWPTSHHVTIVSLGGTAPPRVGYGVTDATLIEQRGDSVLVEATNFLHDVRFRTLLPALGMHTRSGRSGTGYGHGVCWGDLKREQGMFGGRLAAPAALHRTATDPTALATLPAGVFLRWHERVGNRVRVSWFWPRADRAEYTAVVEGWVQSTALPVALSTQRSEQVHGRVQLPANAQSSTVRVVASWFLLDSTVSTRVTTDAAGRFAASADADAAHLTLRAESADGSLVSEPVQADPWPGGTDPDALVLPLVPATRVRGHVRDERHRARARVKVELETPGLDSYAVVAVTDAAGRFEASLPVGTHMLHASDRAGERDGQVEVSVPSVASGPIQIELRLAPTGR